MEAIRQVDLLFTTKSFQMPYLMELRGGERTFFLHHGYNPQLHRPRLPDLGEDQYLWDIVYVGNADAHKFRWLLPVAEAFGNKRILVAGNRWKEMAAGTALEPFVLPQVIVGDRLALVHQLGRINLGIHGGTHQRTGWRDYVSMRTFEIPACKGFMLHEDNEEIRTLFNVDGEIDIFSDAAGLCERIDHYLDRPQRRREMIERAYARAVPAYSYAERARTIIAACEAHRAGTCTMPSAAQG